MKNRIFGISGYKNSGKTTLVERVVAELTRRGHRVSTVKHAHHMFDIDHPGRDSHRHRVAGAREVCVVSGKMWAVIHSLEDEPEPDLDEVLNKLSPADVVIVEGYKHDRYPKIEVRNTGLAHPPLADNDPSVVAIAASGPVETGGLPVFSRDDIAAICDLIADTVGLSKS